MMRLKTFLSVILILVLGNFNIASAQAPATQEEITITTYYPAPYGDYAELTVSGSITGTGTILDVAPTFTADADANVFTAVRINPTFNDGIFNPQHNGLIVEDGNVGIGTTAPVTRLDVVDFNAQHDGVVIHSGHDRGHDREMGVNLMAGWFGNVLEVIGSYHQTASAEPACGFGIVSGGGIASPIVWVWEDERNAFEVIQKTWPNNLGNDPVLFTVRSQGNVGIGTRNPRALLDITSTTSGFLPPRMTAAQRDAIANPPQGSVIYNIDAGSEGLNHYNGTGWARVGAAGFPVPNLDSGWLVVNNYAWTSQNDFTMASGVDIRAAEVNYRIFTLAALHAAHTLGGNPNNWFVNITVRDSMGYIHNVGNGGVFTHGDADGNFGVFYSMMNNTQMKIVLGRQAYNQRATNFSEFRVRIWEVGS